MSFGNVDKDFDSFRRKRIRQNQRNSSDPANYENAALRELELVEQREVRDQQLTREVHEFFASATRQAATIVERMALDAEAEADTRIGREMESFLIDSFARMNALVLAMLQKKRGNGGEEKLEPNINNIVGAALDTFRSAGTAELIDKHIGKDPFDTDLDEVRRELLDSMNGAEATPQQAAAASIGDHLVAELSDEAPDDADQGEPAAEPDDDATAEVAADVDASTSARDAARARLAERLGEPNPGRRTTGDNDLDRFKEALRSLVRQGMMTRDEARAAWSSRLQSLGIS